MLVGESGRGNEGVRLIDMLGRSARQRLYFDGCHHVVEGCGVSEKMALAWQLCMSTCSRFRRGRFRMLNVFGGFTW